MVVYYINNEFLYFDHTLNLYDGDEWSSGAPTKLSSSSEFPFNKGDLSDVEGGETLDVEAEVPIFVPNLLSCTNFESIWFSIPRA